MSCASAPRSTAGFRIMQNVSPEAVQPQPSSLSLWERARVRVRPSANIYAKNADVENKDSNPQRRPVRG